MRRRLVVGLVVIAVAYAVGWWGDAWLTDDPCGSAFGRETDRYDYVERWFPVRTDCRVTTPSGASRLELGSSEVFLTLFTLTLATGLVLVSGVARAVRAATVLASCVVAFLVIFVL